MVFYAKDVSFAIFVCLLDIIRIYFFSALERKISVRANREHLVQKGILLPDSPISPISEPGEFNCSKFYSQSV